MSCLVPGCGNDPRSRFTLKLGRLCEEHWRKLPLALRQEYWDVTEYGKLDLPEELATKLMESLNVNTGKLDQAQDQESVGQVS